VIDDLREHIFKCNECDYSHSVCEFCKNGEEILTTNPKEGFIECT